MISKKCFYDASTFKFSIQIITLYHKKILIYLLSSSYEKVDLRPEDDLYNIPFP